MTDKPDISDWLLEVANADSSPEDLMLEMADELDGTDLCTIFEILADKGGYATTSAFLENETSLAKGIIDATQSNSDKAWDRIWKIALLQDSLEDH